MQQQIQKNIFIYKFLSGLSPVGFSKYTISYISFKPKEAIEDCFGKIENDSLKEKLEGKIVVKAWKELPSRFKMCILGDFSLTPDTFSGIVMVDNSQALDNPEKYIPRIITSFKNRSTLLLNQFHGTHGRVFWENSYESINIDNVESFNRALKLLKGNL
jgi:hypothetical protein